MNCDEIQRYLDAGDAAATVDLERARIGRHIESCAACRAAAEAAARVREGLAQLPDATPPAGFAERVIGAAVARGERRRAARRIRAAGIAAGLALCAIVVALLPRPGEAPPVQATVTLDERVKLVRLAIDSTASVDSARLTITLSDNLGIEGYGSRRTLTWNTPLKAGVNLLSLPVYAVAQGDGEIAASLQIGEQHKAFVVRTRNPGAGLRGPHGVAA